MFKTDPLVVRMVRLLVEPHDNIAPDEQLDWLVASLGVVASDNKWHYLMQVCLPLIAEVPEALYDDIGTIDDDQLLGALVFGHRINEALHLKLHGRAAIAERLRMVRLPARLWNVPRTDRWVSIDTVREMLANIREQARRLPAPLRRPWATHQLAKRCAGLNARMLDAADFQLLRHQMATGRQWVRLTKASETDAVHIRIHYASGILSVALRTAGFAKTKRRILPLLIGHMLSDEERHSIDRHFALSFLSSRVFETLWLLREGSPAEQILPYLTFFYVLLFQDLLADPAVRARLATMGEYPTIVVTAHGTLAQLPFAALFDGENYMAEKFNVVQAAPLHSQKEFEPGDIDYGALVGGEPIHPLTFRFLAGGENLPQIDHELADLLALVRSIGLTIEVGPPADEILWSVDTLRWLFNTTGVALLSAHMRSSVSEAAKAVIVTPDGRELSIGDALTGLISARLVILAGCSSGGYTDWLSPGESSVVSLLRRAGAKAVISTLWPINDYAARLYNVALVTALTEGASRAAAHGKAQRAVMEQVATIGQAGLGERLARRRNKNSDQLRETDVKFNEPHYWAAFTLTGAWR